MSRIAAQLSLSMVAIIVGVMLIGQLRSQAPAIELSSLTAQELSDLISTLESVNTQLGNELSAVTQQVDGIQRRAVEGESDLLPVREEAVRLSAFAGMVAVEGQGIVLEIEAPIFQPTNVTDLIHELRSAGAEAIAIDDIRITASSVPVLGTGAVEIDGVEISNAFTVTAIGSPDGLKSALERPGGMLQLLQLSIEATYRIETREHVTIPATERDLAPQVAQPVE
jgi:uncharacterized protein YlxW (UPF0749 family)